MSNNKKSQSTTAENSANEEIKYYDVYEDQEGCFTALPEGKTNYNTNRWYVGTIAEDETFRVLVDNMYQTYVCCSLERKQNSSDLYDLNEVKEWTNEWFPKYDRFCDDEEFQAAEAEGKEEEYAEEFLEKQDYDEFYTLYEIRISKEYEYETYGETFVEFDWEEIKY